MNKTLEKLAGECVENAVNAKRQFTIFAIIGFALAATEYGVSVWWLYQVAVRLRGSWIILAATGMIGIATFMAYLGFSSLRKAKHWFHEYMKMRDNCLDSAQQFK